LCTLFVVVACVHEADLVKTYSSKDEVFDEYYDIVTRSNTGSLRGFNGVSGERIIQIVKAVEFLEASVAENCEQIALSDQYVFFMRRDDVIQIIFEPAFVPTNTNLIEETPEADGSTLIELRELAGATRLKACYAVVVSKDNGTTFNFP